MHQFRSIGHSRRAALRSLVLAGPLAAAPFALAAAPARLAAQGVGYTVAPQATQVRWANDLGLDNALLYGGNLSFDFERYLSLQGSYFTNSGVQSTLGDLSLTDNVGNALTDQDVGLRSYGAKLRVNLGAGRFVPFLLGGGGVLQVRPDGGRRSDQISVSGGGGLRVGIVGPLKLELTAEDLMFRINRYQLAAAVAGAPGYPADPDANKVRHNLVVGAGLALPLGAPRADDQGPSRLFGWGLRGLSLVVEPTAGRLYFDDAQNIADQNLAGVRAGMDLGRYVGLRGFYWQGVNDGFSATSPLRSYGGEAQFRLNSGAGVTPFLLAGAGALDYGSNFRNEVGVTPDNKTSLILGGGLTFPIAERFVVNLAARDYVFSEESIDNTSTTNDLRNNWLVSGGLRFSIGGRSGRAALREARADARDRQLRDSTALARATTERDSSTLDFAVREAALRDSLARLVVERDSAALARRDTLVATSPSATTTTTVQSAVPLAGAPLAATDSVVTTVIDGQVVRTAPQRAYVSDRTVTIATPTEGELYVRYGPATGASRVAPTAAPADSSVSASALRQAIRDALREERAERAREDEALGVNDRRTLLRDGVSTYRADTVRTETVVEPARVIERRDRTVRSQSAAPRTTTTTTTTTRPAPRHAAARTTTTRTTVASGPVPAARTPALTTRSSTPDARDEQRVQRRIDSTVAERVRIARARDAQAHRDSVAACEAAKKP